MMREGNSNSERTNVSSMRMQAWMNASLLVHNLFHTQRRVSDDFITLKPQSWHIKRWIRIILRTSHYLFPKINKKERVMGYVCMCICWVHPSLLSVLNRVTAWRLILQVVAVTLGFSLTYLPTHTSLWLSGLYLRAIKNKTPSANADTTKEQQKIV